MRLGQHHQASLSPREQPRLRAGSPGCLLTMKTSELGQREVTFSSTFTACFLGSIDTVSSLQRSFRPW